MSARLSARFAKLREENRAGLVAYVMAGDPDLETSYEILRRLPAAGADVIELGFPFSDPMADGPSIQHAAQRALAAGTTLAKTLDLAARLRAEDAETPLALMGYANPVEQMGYGRFAERAAAAGVDGALIVDLPPEEDGELRPELAARDLDLIRLATPTTDETRLTRILDGASGFVYYVSVTGVTGVRAASVDEVGAAVARLKAATALPVAVGFGVRSPESAAAIAKWADAVVIGSAFVDVVAEKATGGDAKQAPEAVAARVRELAAAVRGARIA